MNALSLLGAVGAQQIILLVVVGLLVVALIVMPMFTNKKRQKAIQELHSSIRVGTKVKTVGGIVGTIIAINEINAVEKEFTLETGAEGSKSTMVFDFNAIYQVMSAAPAEAAPKAEAEPVVEEAAAEAQEEKKD